VPYSNPAVFSVLYRINNRRFNALTCSVIQAITKASNPDNTYIQSALKPESYKLSKQIMEASLIIYKSQNRHDHPAFYKNGTYERPA
jgi:hypothetical protein